METTPADAATQVPTSPDEKAATPTTPVKLTERAVARVKEIIKEQKFEGYFFAVRVVPAGCSGLGYDLNLVKESKPGDLIWDQEGVQIATDALSNKYLAGTEIDFQTGLQGAGFKFLNPNAKQSCGCGTSFST